MWSEIEYDRQTILPNSQSKVCVHRYRKHSTPDGDSALDSIGQQRMMLKSDVHHAVVARTLNPEVVLHRAESTVMLMRSRSAMDSLVQQKMMLGGMSHLKLQQITNGSGGGTGILSSPSQAWDYSLRYFWGNHYDFF